MLSGIQGVEISAILISYKKLAKYALRTSEALLKKSIKK